MMKTPVLWGYNATTTGVSLMLMMAVMVRRGQRIIAVRALQPGAPRLAHYRARSSLSLPRLHLHHHQQQRAIQRRHSLFYASTMRLYNTDQQRGDDNNDDSDNDSDSSNGGGRRTTSTTATSLSSSRNSTTTMMMTNGYVNGAAASASSSSATESDHDDASFQKNAPDAAATTATTSSSSSSTVYDATSLLAIDPADVEIVTVDMNNDDDTTTAPPPALSSLITGDRREAWQATPMHNSDHELKKQRLPFVSMFRGSANYIANHRNTLAVYHVPGGLLDLPDPTVFRDLMNDVALTWLLGMKIVIVVGCRHQIEKRKRQQQQQQQQQHSTTITLTHDDHGSGGDSSSTSGLMLRVTNEEDLRMVKEEAGYVRFEVERQLARSLRMQGGGTLGNTAGGGGGGHGYYDGNVVSGNFYSAQPFGILDGVDYKYTGFVRRVEVEKIRQLHASRDICLLTTLGVSPSGEVFNVNSQALAATVAGAMGASKIMFFTEKEMELRNLQHGNKIQSLRLSDARNLLTHHHMKLHRKGFVEYRGHGHDPSDPTAAATAAATATPAASSSPLDRAGVDMLYKIGWSIQAIEQGVKRAHIISPKHGALLQELYTRDGSGMLVSGDLYEGIRRANVHDVAGIHDLISPLIQMGTLIDRPKSTLEKDIDSYFVYTRDNHIVACGQLKLFEEGHAEIGCLVVNSEYRSRGRGDAMLGYLERLCLKNGCSLIFVLSTQTMEWFVERGFDEVKVDQLPPTRQASYNHKRASKIYLKKIESSRDLDASELWWNR